MLDEDQLARERIFRDLNTTFLVEAGAGSGKTASLVGRMINFVKSGKTPVEQIAAITFTNKAAAELQTRFRIQLEKEWRTSPCEQERKALEAAIQNINQCFIGTIHSFCAQLLRQRPIEAGLDPSFAEMDEMQSREFRDQCWDLYLEQLMETGREEQIEHLAMLDVHVEDLRAVYHRVSQYEDVDLFCKDSAYPDFDLIRFSLPPMLDEAVKYIPTSPPAGDFDPLQITIRDARRMLRYLNLSKDLEVLKLARLFDRAVRVTQNRWTDKNMAKQIRDRFEDWQLTVLHPFLQAWREYLHPHVIKFVLPAIEYCRQLRMEAGLADFQDLLMKAAKLLREHKDVRHYFNRRYTRLLVDEFQDTDPIQAEMMFLLTGDQPDENDWRKQRPRPGSLFIVGDPKQSIYRFRRADISLYMFVKERIRANGDVLRLMRNFRSVQSIGNYVNYAFQSKFAVSADNSSVQAPYVEMLTDQPNPKDKKALHGVFTLVAPKIQFDKKADIADLDAKRIARWIAWACKGNLKIQENNADNKTKLRLAQPGDFMILLKRKEYINLYAEKLEKYGIASDTSGSQTVYEEIQALSLLAKCLNDATDRIPLLAVLRGMLFGVSDDALYQYRKEAGAITIFPLAEKEQLSDKALPVLQALQTLRKYAEWVSTLPAWTAFAKIAQHLGIIPYTAVQETGAIRSGTLVKLLQLIQANASAAASWNELTLYLQRLTGPQTLESTSLFAGAGNAVRIMNLHKAKGLEAPVVFLACPCGNKDHSAEEHIDRLSEPATGFFTISRPKDSYSSEVIAQPIGWPEFSAREREFMRAEEERLLYVATTRSRQLLVISCYPCKPGIDPWSPLEETLAKQLELDEHQAEPIEPIQAEPLFDSPHLDKSLSKWNTWLQQAAKPTFQRTNVTEQSKINGDLKLHRTGEGRGMAFGSVVHRCLEALGNGMPAEQLQLFANMVCEEEELKNEWAAEAVQTVQIVIESDIWQRGMNAKRRYHEFSFTVAKPDKQKPETVVKGVIDFLFEEEDGWVIVDFKTDIFEEQHEDEFVDFYRPQVLAYVDEWVNTFEYKVKEAGLYFLNRNRYVQI